MTSSKQTSGSLQDLAESIRRITIQDLAIALAITVLLIAVANVSLQRTHFGPGVESDFTGVFGPEAERVLAGERLQLRYHPPGYAFAVASGHVITGGWLSAGLWISGLSAAIFLIASVLTFRRLAGTAAAWGTLVASACSANFFRLASTASSDMLFAALVALLLALVIKAMDEPDRLVLWLCSGIVAACAFLTRTTGLAIAAILVAPFLIPAARSSGFRNLGALTAGFLLPLLAWTFYAIATNSPLMPTGNHVNLAVSVFGDESKPWSENARKLESQFKSVTEVVAHDPARVMSQLTRRMLSLPKDLAAKLTWPPIVALAIPGLVFMLWRRRTPAILLLLVICGSLTLLSGIVKFHPRFHLVLIPIVGAMAALTCTLLLNRFVSRRSVRVALSSLLIFVVAAVSARTYALNLSEHESIMQVEIAEAIPHVLRKTEREATIYARKVNIGFESGRSAKMLSNVSSFALLHRKLCLELEPGEPAYLYVGTMERKHANGFMDDPAAAKSLPWLELIASGAETEWVLYRIRLYEPGLPQNQQCPAALASE